MNTQSRTTLPVKQSDCCRILGVNFFNGNALEAVDRMSTGRGLLVVPAAPALKDLGTNLGYREALLNADCVITDSAFMVMIWNQIGRTKVQRLSGLTYLRELLSRDDVRTPGATFWIMPSEESARRNSDWLNRNGVPLAVEDMYIAPVYGRDIDDPKLLEVLRARQPRHIIVTIGGGTQERLGLYLKRNVDFQPSIHCIGAAIGFLSGDQVHIPAWADQAYLGWLFRCLSDPQRYVARYWSARKLLGLMLRYGAELPEAEV